MIGLGAYLIDHFDWILYVFGAFLVWTGYPHGARRTSSAIEPEANPVIRLVRRFVPVTGTLPRAELLHPRARRDRGGRGGWRRRSSSSSCWSRRPT